MKRSLQRTVIVMILSLLSSTSLWATTYGGKCGANITWKMNKQGDLILTGTGDMYNYSVSNWDDENFATTSPWGKMVKTITIEDGITSIGSFAFGACTNLEAVDIGESVKYIGAEAFSLCRKLSLFVVHAIEPPVIDSWGMISGKSCFEITLEVPQGSEVKYFFADQWKEFYERKLCGETMSWTLDDSGALSIFGAGEMYDYSESGKNVAPWGKNITSVYISDGITRIGNNAFNGCTNVCYIRSLPKVPPTIGTNFFPGIKKKYCCVDMPEGAAKEYMTAEGWKDLFNFCGETIAWSRTNGTTDYKVTITGDGEMYDYESIVDVPWECYFVNAVDIHEGVTSIGTCAFSHTSITSLEIPNSVTKIKEKAFYNTKAKSIKIGSGVTEIEYRAFGGNYNLEHITILAEEPPHCDAESFRGNPKDITLEVPEQSVEKYKNADVWKDFYKIVTDINEIDTNDNWTISVENGNIVINNAAENMQVAVYNISGATIYQGTAKTIATPKAGIYIVRVGNKTTKVAVK